MRNYKLQYKVSIAVFFVLTLIVGLLSKIYESEQGILWGCTGGFAGAMTVCLVELLYPTRKEESDAD